MATRAEGRGERHPRSWRAGRPQAVDVSVVMPCLNEERTLASCIAAAQSAFRSHGLAGEVLVADNGSTDRSRQIARRLRARVVVVRERGYGNALRAGIGAARGKYIVMGDADCSYDFAALPSFVARLEHGFDLVMGNRFQGGIERGAMPFLHRWVGNPVLSLVGRIFFRAPVRDFHCGIRAFTKAAYREMDLHATGMELASEMVIKASLRGMHMCEVPTVLRKDGRDRAPHLRTWRDGWRHLRFMLLFSPRWLFLVPGASAFVAGLAVSFWLLGGGRRIGPVGFDVDTLLVAGFVTLVGYELVMFAVFTKVFAIHTGFHPPHRALSWLFRYVDLEVGLLAGGVMCLAGTAMLVYAAWSWGSVGFGALDPRVSMRAVIPAAVLFALGTQTVFASFFLSILGLEHRPPGPPSARA